MSYYTYIHTWETSYSFLGVHTTRICIRRESHEKEVPQEPVCPQRAHDKSTLHRNFWGEHVPVDMEDNVCGVHDTSGNASPVLQWHCRYIGRNGILAIDSLFPDRDVHSSKEDREVDKAMDDVAIRKRNMFPSVSSRPYRIRRRRDNGLESLSTFQDPILILENKRQSDFHTHYIHTHPIA